MTRKTVTLLATTLFAMALLAPPVGAKALPWGLYTDTLTWSQNPDAPKDCWTEDDWHLREWYGGPFSGTVTVTEPLCPTGPDNAGWMAFNVSIGAKIDVIGSISRLTITSPSGVVVPASLTSKTALKGGKTESIWTVCVANVDGYMLAGGTWTISLSGSWSNARYRQEAAPGTYIVPNYGSPTCAEP